MDYLEQANYLERLAEHLTQGVCAHDITRPEDDAADLVAWWLENGGASEGLDAQALALLRRLVVAELDTILLWQ